MRRQQAVDTNALPDMMPRVAQMLGVTGSTISQVREQLQHEGWSESDIYFTIKGAAMCYPHVKQALEEATIEAALGERLPDTERG